MTDLELTFKRFDGAAAREAVDVVRDLYEASHEEQIASGDQFRATKEFMRRFDRYAFTDGFEMVVAHESGEPIGLTWGWPLRPGGRWWEGLLTDLGEDFTVETGERTFALSEIMVAREWEDLGVGHALHDELLGARPEQRATLLVSPTNERAYTAYKRWGWKCVGQLRPHWDGAPTFDVLMHDLGRTGGGAPAGESGNDPQSTLPLEVRLRPGRLSS